MLHGFFALAARYRIIIIIIVFLQRYVCAHVAKNVFIFIFLVLTLFSEIDRLHLENIILYARKFIIAFDGN